MTRRSRSPRTSEMLWQATHAIGSVQVAVVLLTLVGLILVLSTTAESMRGTTFAQRFFYQAGWFDGLLALLGLNIVCATVTRWPFKRKHTGFIVTHIGIVLLLAGSLLTRLYGIEGQMLLYEGETSDEIFTNSYEVMMHREKDVVTRVLPRRADPRAPLFELDGGKKVVLTEILDRAVEKEDILEAPEGARVNPAARLTLSSGTMGFSQTVWLVKDKEGDAHSAAAQVGPAVAELIAGPPPPATEKDAPARKAPTLVFERDGKVVAEIDAAAAKEGASFPVGSTGYKIEALRYMPDARVGTENKLENASDEPRNPAVAYELVAPDGKKTREIEFANFPDFASMHGKEEKPAFDARLDMPGGTPKVSHPTLRLYYDGGRWMYQFLSAKAGAAAEPAVPVEEGKEYAAGWMDFRLSVDELLERARVERRMAPGSEKKGQVAARLAVVDAGGKRLSEDWAIGERGATLDTGGTPVHFMLRQGKSKVPFSLSLEDFRKVDYPGTNRPASYESDVRMHDSEEHLQIGKTIKMNQPLDHRGFRVFQSSYIEDRGEGEASVFTIAKNPGIGLIYGGSIILFLGSYLVFFVPQLSSLPNNRTEK